MYKEEPHRGMADYKLYSDFQQCGGLFNSSLIVRGSTVHCDSASPSARFCLSHILPGELPKSIVHQLPIKNPHFQETRSKKVPAQIPEHPYGELLGLLRNEENYVLPLLQDLADMYQYTMRRQE